MCCAWSNWLTRLTDFSASGSQQFRIGQASIVRSAGPWLPYRAMLSGGALSSRQLPLPDGVGQVRHPRGGFRADLLQGHAARVHALEQADSGAEQHG